MTYSPDIPDHVEDPASAFEMGTEDNSFPMPLDTWDEMRREAKAVLDVADLRDDWNERAAHYATGESF